MKLYEITKISHQPSVGFVLTDFDTDGAVQLTTAENLPLYQITGGHKDPSLCAFALKVDDTFVSVIIGVWGKVDGPAFIIRRTWTDPRYRNKGLVTSLYKALHAKMHYKLVSDIEQSPETISVWLKLSAVLPVKVLDLNNKEIKNLEDVSAEDLYKPSLELRLIIEQVQTSSDWIVPEQPLLGGILEDHLVYTHTDSNGQFC
jgi:hypothetical protein